MEKFGLFWLFFVLAWFLFAFFDLTFDREVFRAYTATEVVNYEPDEGGLRLNPNAVTEYRVLQETVILNVGGYLTEYEDCTIFDRDNWKCIYSDESATFGAVQGKFFNRSNVQKFPHLAQYADEEALSRFGYIILQCRWDATDGIGIVMCLFRPFTT